MIKCIREYNLYDLTLYDIIYTDGSYITKVRTVSKCRLPQTALRYMEKATKTQNIYQKRGRTETEFLYEVKE